MKWRNKDRLFANLRNTVPAIDSELRGELADGGDELVEKAKSFAPEDSGDLRDSIRWEWTKSTTLFASKSPAIRFLAGSKKAFYARWVEFNHPRQPFFFPAYRLLRRRIKGRMSRALTRAIKKSGFGTK